MSRKTKFRFTFAALLLILLGGGYMLADFLAGPPSRFDELAAQSGELQRRVELTRRPAHFTLPTSGTWPQVAAAGRGAPTSPQGESAASRNHRETLLAAQKALSELSTLDQDLDRAIAAATPGLHRAYTLVDIIATTESEILRDPSGALALAPATRERIRHQIEIQFAMHPGALIPRRDARSTTQAAAFAALRVKLHQVLDRTDKILLTPGWAAAAPTLYLMDYGPLAIQRAALRGAPAKAATLFQHLLQALHIASIDQFRPQDRERLFMPNSGLYRRLEAALAQLSRAGAFPSQAFDTARRILAAGHLDTSQTADLRAHYALSRRYEVQSLMNAQYTRYNRWNSLLGGFPQYCLNSILAPRARREADELIMAWTRDDPAAVAAAWRDYQQTMRRMNIDQNNDRACALLAEMSHMDRGGVTPEEFLYVDFARLFLAAAHFRQARGRLPESLAELVPNFADREFATPIDGAWIVFPAPAIRAADPRIWNTPQAQDALKWQAQTQKSRAKKASSILEAFKDYPGDPKLAETLHNGYLTLPERPVVCRLRPIPASWTWAEASVFFRYASSDEFEPNFPQLKDGQIRPPLYALTCAFPVWGDEETLLELLRY